MTGIAFVLHVAMQYVEDVIPGDTELPFRLTTFTGRLNSTRPFQLRGLNFDPQRLLNEAESEYRDELGLSENTEAPTPTTTAEPEQKGNGTHFGNQLYILRRGLFFIFAFMYFVTILACLL
uniref:Uncharacterized protein n=1 Tax=Plectus sambesii TaxID=2011161 RepID=A0A914XJQ7_9BILA